MGKIKKGLRERLHNRCWKLMSEIVRRREKGVCYTCGLTKEWKKQQAGHYKHGVLDFDWTNIHCQCIGCNYFAKGNLKLYKEKLINQYGKDGVDLLTKKAKNFQRYEIHELEDILAILKNIKKELED